MQRIFSKLSIFLVLWRVIVTWMVSGFDINVIKKYLTIIDTQRTWYKNIMNEYTTVFESRWNCSLFGISSFYQKNLTYASAFWVNYLHLLEFFERSYPYLSFKSQMIIYPSDSARKIWDDYQELKQQSQKQYEQVVATNNELLAQWRK